MMLKVLKGSLCAYLIAALSVTITPTLSAQSDDVVSVLIRASKPYTELVSAIESSGGRVKHQYKYVDAIAADLPQPALVAVRALVGPANVTKDETMVAPRPVDMDGPLGPADTSSAPEISSDEAEPIADLATDLATTTIANPDAYLLNNGIMSVAAQHAAGFRGQGMRVAVIDTGIRPGFPHLSLDGSVIGCEDFVGDAFGCSHAANNGHGTFVAGMISANVIFPFSAASPFRNAVLAHCPSCFSNPPTNTQIPMIGTAPLSSIYALRVFGPMGGAPTSRIIAAVERVIELREAFEAGEPGGVNIRIANLSLGGPTTFAGRDVLDMAIDALLEHDIVPVIAAGNTGPSSLTVGSPGTAFNAVTVGAANLAHNERILRHFQFGPVIGPRHRPFGGAQMAFFSSRGPDADGRNDPDVVANGFASYGQGFGATILSIDLASGTSFSAGSVAGVAAVLRQRHPTATANQIRNAIIMSANPSLLADGSTAIDQGAGFVNVGEASALLAAGSVPDTFPEPSTPTKNVKPNVEQGTTLEVLEDVAQVNTGSLKPGQRYDLLYHVTPNTKQVLISINAIPVQPPAQQNQLFGDNILLTVHSAKTSAIGGAGDYKLFGFVSSGTFIVDDPEQGIMRFTVNGSWRNAGDISADVLVVASKEALPINSASGMISEGQRLAFPVPIPPGVSKAEFLLSFREDWGNYPTSDLDLILVTPGGLQNRAGATLNAPERATISNPVPGTWVAIVDGFQIHTIEDKFELRVSLDGNVVKID